MTLQPGTRIGPYEVVSRLGAGGMGEVYLARDVKLGREVALKIMLEDAAADPELVARFEREARTLAGLNHTNIAQIYGLEESGGSLALIMEMVDGPTLAERISAGPIPMPQAIELARQMTEALAYAHERGVIHRDLKPGNVKVRTDGTVKILDFGLAKKVGGAGRADMTVPKTLTMTGTVMGTPGYMAPELLRGADADQRTDIFAFGVMLFELFTGRHPFERPSVFEVGEAILNPEPASWPLTARNVPEVIQLMVLKAIEKDPEDRFQSVKELRRDLRMTNRLSGAGITPAPPDLQIDKATIVVPSGQAAARSGAAPAAPASVADSTATIVRPSAANASSGTSGAPTVLSGVAAVPSGAAMQQVSSAGGYAYPSGPSPTYPSGVAVPSPTASEIVPPRQAHRWIWPAVAAVVVLAAGGGGAWYYFGRTPEPVPVGEVKMVRVTDAGNVGGAAFSPDGKQAAYVARTDKGQELMVRDVAGGNPVKAWTADLIVEVQWTSDGSKLIASGMIGNLVSTWIIPRLGGNATLLAPKDVQTGAHIAVSPDGKQVATAYQDSKAVRVFPIDGGSPSVIQMGQIRWLIGLDWGRATNRIAVLTQDDTKLSTVWTVAPDGSDRREVYSDTSTLASLRWSPFGNVLYIIRANGEVGDVIRLEPGAGDSAKPNVILPGLNWDAANPYSRHSSLSTDGRRLLHLRGSSYSNLHRMNTSNGESSEITMGTLRYGRPAVSPDGRWIATAVGSYAKSSVVKIPIQGGDPIPLTSGDSLDSGPVWSPDGERLAFVSSRGNSQRIWMVSADGGPAVEVPDSAASTDPGLQWTSDGRLIWLKPGEGDHVVRQVATGSVDTLVKPPPPGMSNGIFTEARASKTGDVVAVWWNRTVSSKQPDGIWLIFKSTREERLLYQNAFFYPAGWSPDGQWLYAYEYLGRDIIRVPVSGGKFVQVGKFPLGEIESCATTPDGREVICAVGETKSDAWLAENFDPQAPQPPGR